MDAVHPFSQTYCKFKTLRLKIKHTKYRPPPPLFSWFSFFTKNVESYNFAKCLRKWIKMTTTNKTPFIKNKYIFFWGYMSKTSFQLLLIFLKLDNCFHSNVSVTKNRCCTQFHYYLNPTPGPHHSNNEINLIAERRYKERPINTFLNPVWSVF